MTTERYARPGTEAYTEAVLALVDQIPRGRATTYGALADSVRALTGRGGPRQVAAVMARYGGSVAWWRVVRADGTLPPALQAEARQNYLAEGMSLRPDGRIDLARAWWQPDENGL